MLSLPRRLRRRLLQVTKSTQRVGLRGTSMLVLRFLARNFVTIPYLAYLRATADDGLVRKNIEYPGTRIETGMYLDVHDVGISRQLLLAGSREERVVEAVAAELAPGMTVLEIGANIGYYTLLQSRIVGHEGSVHAIEPVSENYALLQRNVEAFGDGNVETYNVAVSNTSGTASMTLTEASNLGTLTDVEDEERISDFGRSYWSTIRRESREVETTSADEFVAERDIQDVDLIRMDIEGHEVEAIEGMTEMLRTASAPCTVVVEVHMSLFEDGEAVARGLVEAMAAAGFDEFRIVFEDEVLTGLDAESVVGELAASRGDDPHVLARKTRQDDEVCKNEEGRFSQTPGAESPESGDLS